MSRRGGAVRTACTAGHGTAGQGPAQRTLRRRAVSITTMLLATAAGPSWRSELDFGSARQLQTAGQARAAQLVDQKHVARNRAHGNALRGRQGASRRGQPSACCHAARQAHFGVAGLAPWLQQPPYLLEALEKTRYGASVPHPIVAEGTTPDSQRSAVRARVRDICVAT